METLSKNKKDRTLLILIIVIVLGGLFIWWAFSLGSKDGVKVESSINSYKVASPSQLTVEYSVSNTSSTTGKSYCSITMQDKTNTYRGSDFDYKSAKTIEPGETYTGVATLKVSNEGAKYITDGGITCTIKPE